MPTIRSPTKQLSSWETVLYDALPVATYITARLGMALKASNVVGYPVTLHQIW
jgi:hypothetical protein